MTTYAEKLAGFTTELRFDAIPDRIIENGKLRILDVVGICLATYDEPFARAVRRVASTMGVPAPGQGDAHVIGSGERLSAPLAALVNGAVTHGPDFDDTHNQSVTHASAVVVPAALASGQAAGASGRETLTAAVAGWEIITRLGMAAPGRFHDRGFHATAVCGTPAAALVAGRLNGLSPAELTNALGISGSQAAGIFEYLQDGSWVKRLHPGWAGHGGTVAALLAGEGFLGPATVLEGRFGLFNTHVGEGEYDPRVLTHGLGETWETEKIVFKPYPCCHFNHACIDSVRALRAEHGFSAEEVKHVTCRVHPKVAPIVCEPAEHKRRPRTDYDAKFSLVYCVAEAIRHGNVDLQSFQPERIQDPATLALIDRITCETDASLPYPQAFPGAVSITLKSGARLERETHHNWGSLDNPMTPAQIEDKFRQNASPVLPQRQVDRILDAVDSLEAMADINELMELTRVVQGDERRRL